MSGGSDGNEPDVLRQADTILLPSDILQGLCQQSVMNLPDVPVNVAAIGGGSERIRRGCRELAVSRNNRDQPDLLD